MNKKNDKESLFCSFCGKSQKEVKKLIAGPTVFVCDECVELCMDIIKEDTKNSKTKNFDRNLDYLLFKRRKSVKSDKVSVTNIINDVKKNGDKALIKYEKKFNNLNVPNTLMLRQALQHFGDLKKLFLQLKEFLNQHTKPPALKT